MGSNSSGLEVGADVVNSLSAEFRSSRAIYQERDHPALGGERRRKGGEEEEEGKERDSESSFHSLRQRCGENRDCRVKGTGRWRNIQSSMQLS